MDDKIKEVMGLVDFYAEMYKVYPYWGDHSRMDVDSAHKAIESKLRELVQVPPGYALVPVEPTEEMIEAAEEAYMPFGAMELAYAAMLSAAPKDLVAAAQQGR